jgi:peptidoglycan/xylan/chitin deacetylase (PgdA/CDA1 family)
MATIRYLKYKAFVLMYHRVLETVSEEPVFVQPGMYVTAVTFRKHLDFLKKHLIVLPLGELVKRIEDGKSVNGCCSITFDDGWIDNYTVAFPILKELNVPATIFIVTSYVGAHKLFWPEEFSLLIQQAGLARSPLPPNISSLLFFNKKYDEKNALNQAIEVMKLQTPDQREDILDSLRSISSGYLPPKMMIDWEEVRIMHESGLIDFGAHTANHVILTQVPLWRAEQEIMQSQYDIKSQLGFEADLFAYPNGNFSKDLQSKLKKSGFRAAVTTHKDMLHRNTPVYEIPRIGIHDDVSKTIPLFLFKLLMRNF